MTEHTAWSTPEPQDEAHRTRASETLLPDAQPLAGPGEEPGTQSFLAHAARPSDRSIVRALVLAFFSFVFAAFLIHLLVPRPLYLFADFRSGKLEIMRAWRGRAFSAGFGSSHVHNGFDPRSFDKVLAGTPLRTQTINLAVAGGSQTEQRAMALAFVKQLVQPPSRSHQSCLVLLEMTAGANFTSEHLLHPRAINIYDLPTLRFVSHLTEKRMPLKTRFGRTGFAVVATILHYTNVGSLSNLLFPHLLPDTLYKAETQHDQRGLLSVEDPLGNRPVLAAYIKASPPHPELVNGEVLQGNYDLIRELQQASAVRGVHFVYLVMPKLTDLHWEEVFPDSIEVGGQMIPIVDLGRPDRYPQLYRADQWFDYAHLNAAGADLASSLIAQALGQFYTNHPTDMNCGE